MPDTHDSKRLQKTIIAYSAMGMFVVGLAVGLAGVLPLTQQLRDARRSILLVDLQRQTLAVERFINRVRGGMLLAAGRTRTREKMAEYEKGGISLEDLKATMTQMLNENLPFATNVAGVQMFDTRSNFVAQAGAAIPPGHPVWPDPQSREVVMDGPFRVGRETFLLGGGNILGPDGTRVGTAVVLLHTHGLRNIIEDYTDLGKTGETVVGSRQNKQLPIFFPLRQAGSGMAPSPQRIAAVMDAFQRASENKGDNKSETFEPVSPLDESIILASGPIKGADWSLVVLMQKSELFSGLNRTLLALGTVITFLILAGTFGMVVVLRPLAGRVILHTDELESQIYEKTAALNTELAERKRAENSARDSEALYHSLVDTLPINILRKDLRGRVSYGNRGYCERMGRPLSALLGKTDYDLFPRELADKYLSDDEKVIRSGEVFEDIEEHRGGDGKKLFVHVLKAPVRDAKGDVVGTQVIFWDVTARKLAEESLATIAAELSRSNRELEQFAYVASHDLQEPLRMITSYTQLIGKRYGDRLDNDAKDFMRFAVDGAMRMQKLILGLLEYSRVGTRAKPFEKAHCEEALQGALANLKIAIEEARAEVTHGPLPDVMADPVQLVQLFQNLIGNALKFARPGVPPVVRLTAVPFHQLPPDADPAPPDGAGWRIAVADNGIGFEQGYAERIFELFQRLHARIQYEGTGLGLAIVRKIILRHGATIAARGTPGEGAAFLIDWPQRALPPT